MSKDTPKWTTAIGPTYVAVCEQNGRTIANIDQATDRDAAANARLIAAAPDLLEAAKAMDLDCRADVLNPCYAGRRDDVPGQHWGGGKACAPCTMRAAIAKAEGGDA